MVYAIAWNEAFPAGTNAANQIATYIAQTKTMVRERVDDIFGTSGPTSIQNADPYLPILLKLNGGPTSRILPGATSFAIRDTANTRDNLLLTDDGSLTVFKDLRVDTGQGYIDRYNIGDVNSAIDINWNNSNTQRLRLIGNITPTFLNPKAGAFYTLEIEQDGTGGRTVTWPAGIRWAGGVAPTLTTVGTKIDFISLFYNGTSYFGFVSGLNYDV